jgi:hypothetical protein
MDNPQTLATLGTYIHNPQTLATLGTYIHNPQTLATLGTYIHNPQTMATLRTQDIARRRKTKNKTQKTKKMRNADPTKYRGEPRCLRRISSYFLL